MPVLSEHLIGEKFITEQFTGDLYKRFVADRTKSIVSLIVRLWVQNPYPTKPRLWHWRGRKAFAACMPGRIRGTRSPRYAWRNAKGVCRFVRNGCGQARGDVIRERSASSGSRAHEVAPTGRED